MDPRTDNTADEHRHPTGDAQQDAPPFARVRDDDLEPHEGLRYIALLFKALAVLLLFLLIAEVVVGFRQEGSAALMTILVEATKTVVFAGFLWAAGDLAVMLIESNHDLRATRILLGRLNGKMERFLGPAPVSDSPPAPVPPRDRPAP